MIYRSGRIYEGEWLNEHRNGRGFEQFTDGSKYIGMYKDNKADGKGVFTWRNGEIYDGEFLTGKKQGFGIWKGIFGDSYIGEWSNDKVEGYGVH